MSAYFTFPLPLLDFGAEEKGRLQNIVSYSMLRMGRAYTGDAPELLKQILSNGTPPDFRNIDDHKAVVIGGHLLNVAVGAVAASLNRAKDAQSFIEDHEMRYGNSPLVMVSSTLLWGCHNEDDPPYRLFSALCGILSVIGVKKMPIRITRDMVIARQLGYKSPEVQKQAFRKRQDGAEPLTVQQVRDVLYDLEIRGLIARCHASPRVVYFSTTQNRDDLRESVKKIIEVRDKIKIAREQDRALFHGRNHNGTTKEPLKKENGQNGEAENHLKSENQIGTTTEPHEEPQQEPRAEPLNEYTLNENPPNENPPKEGVSTTPEKKFPSPTQEEVAPLIKSVLLKPKQHLTESLADGWWNEYGSLMDWTKSNWQHHCRRWALDQSSRQGRKAMKE